MSFSGFPDAPDTPEDVRDQSAPTLSKSKVGLSNNTNRRQKEKLLLAAANQKAMSVVDCSGSTLPPEARLAASSTASASAVKLKISDDGKCQVLEKTIKTENTNQSPQEIPNDDNGNISSESSKNENVSKLDAFQEKQKLIEEQNRKKKEMLLQTINDRKKKTDSEAKKLDLVNQELQKIDLMLTSDVKYLRNSIEQASIDYTDAMKRYERAEKEFIEAKLHLHSCQEKKELLTDHLCAIIEQNEMRKSKKLNSLMTELNIQ